MYTISAEKCKPLLDGHKFETEDRIVLYATDADEVDVKNFKVPNVNDMYHNFYGIIKEVDPNGEIKELILFLNVFFLESVLGVDIERAMEDEEDSQIETFGYPINVKLVSEALLANEDKTKPCFIYETKSSDPVDDIFGEQQLFLIHGGWKENDG